MMRGSRRRWGVLATVLVSIVLGVVLAAALIAVQSQRAALDGRDATIAHLLAQSKRTNRELGGARDQIDVLAEQVRQLGGKPVSLGTRIAPTPATSPSTTTTTTTTTSTTALPPPPKPCGLPVCVTVSRGAL